MRACMEIQAPETLASSVALVTIQAGAGGLDAQDWASQLERMYLKYAVRRRWVSEIIDYREGEATSGVRRVTVRIEGGGAYEVLRSEHGVHRICHLSRFGAAGKRQTSFARVEVLPVTPVNPDLAAGPLPDTDVAWEAFRSSGPGGQHRNKVETAVRVKHLPTGLTAVAQQGRSQSANRERALELLAARVALHREQQAKAQADKLRGPRVDTAFGQQVRSYFEHPYQLVHDHRSGRKERHLKALEGQLEELHAELVHSSS